MGLCNALRDFRETKSHRTHAEGDGEANIAPTAGSTAPVYGAPVRDETRLAGTARSAQHDRVVPEVGIDVAQRRQKPGKEFVAGAIGPFKGGFAPQVDFGGYDLLQSRQRNLFLA